MARSRTSRAEIVAQIPVARRAEERDRARGRRALSARYDRRSRRVMIELSNGALFGFPATRVPALARLSAAQLADVTVTPGGSGLAWDALDIHLSVAGLLFDAIDRAATRSELARIAGRARGGAKAAAARANGKKGGRPRTRAAGSPAVADTPRSTITVALRPLGSPETSRPPAPDTAEDRLALLRELSHRAFRAAGLPTDRDDRSVFALRSLREAKGAAR